MSGNLNLIPLVTKNLNRINFFAVARARHSQELSYLLDRPCSVPTCEYYPEYKKSLAGRAWMAAFKDLVWIKTCNSTEYYNILAVMNKMKFSSTCRFSVYMYGLFRSSGGPAKAPERWINRTRYFFNVFASTIVNIIEENNIKEIQFGSHVLHKIESKHNIVNAEMIYFCPIHYKREYRHRIRKHKMTVPSLFSQCYTLENFDENTQLHILEKKWWQKPTSSPELDDDDSD